MRLLPRVLLVAVILFVAWLVGRFTVFRHQAECSSRTMGDMRTIATALESYSISFNEYPATSNLDDLRALLEPEFVRSLPLRDGWGSTFVVRSQPTGYVIQSAGADGALMRVGPDRQRTVELQRRGLGVEWRCMQDVPARE